MYTKPTLAALDLATSTASCCRIILSSGEQSVQIINQPLCPFPAPTGDICIATATGSLTACALAN